MSRGRPAVEVVAEYEVLVRRDPAMPNREVARRLGMTETAMERALARARTRGLLTLRRVGFGHQIELAPPGVTCGAVPLPGTPRHRRRRKKDLDRAT